jgi:dienelactone hydrolase
MKHRINKMIIHIRILSLAALLVMTSLFLSAATLAEDAVRSSYVSIPVSAGDKSWSLAAKLNYPLDSANGAAVLIVHGSGGIDSRGELHTKSLNAAGFVTLEIDLWAARGWMGDSFGRPSGVPETLPDAFAALSFLADLGGVDANRIGVVGFSWGGVVSMLSRSTVYLNNLSGGHQFAANVAFYPVCWVYNKVSGYELNEVVTQPLLILTGELDDYDTPTSCLEWQTSLNEPDQGNVEIVVYPRSYHGFNTSAASMEVTDPFSHQGKGGQVAMKADEQSRVQSDRAVVEFFSKNLGSENE